VGRIPLEGIGRVGNLPGDGPGLLLPRHAGFSENRKIVMAITAIGWEPT
jgi:hypothetical protein